MSVRRPLLLLVLVLGFSATAFPQLPSLLTPQPATAAPSTPAIPPDPLGRETPRGTLLGFIKAAQEEHYAVAIEYFQPAPSRRRRSEQDDEEVAAQLLTIFNQKFAGALELTSRDPLGRLDDGLPPDQEKITGALGATDKFPVQLVRLDDEQGRKLWYFSRITLDHVPEMFGSLTFPEIEKQIPQTLVTHRLLFMPLWQWIALVVFLPIALLGGRLVSRFPSRPVLIRAGVTVELVVLVLLFSVKVPVPRAVALPIFRSEGNAGTDGIGRRRGEAPGFLGQRAVRAARPA